METKFKIGDTIICTSAAEPTPCIVSDIDIVLKRYILDYKDAGYVSFGSEHRWELHTAVVPSLTGKNIKHALIRAYMTGISVNGARVSAMVSEECNRVVDKIYDDLKKNSSN